MAEVQRFDLVDYVVFGTMIAISAAIGIYSAFTDGRQRTAEEIVLGNRNLNPIAVGLSICASFISSVLIIGTPGEIYRYDTMYSWSLVAYISSSCLISLILLPIYFRFKVTSVNEYLELRFNKALRVLATLCLLLSTGLLMGIALYTPALALNAVTGMSMWASILTTGLACTFYTSLGGIKAVVWTDSLQTIIMIAGIVAVVVQGTIEVGGVDEVLRRGVEGKRIRFLEISPDPAIIYSVWSVMLGLGVSNMRLGISQIMAQRLISCGTRIKATQAVMVSVVGYVFIMSLTITSGVVMYAYYFGCDPLTSGVVQSQDQIMPLLVMELFVSVPGIPGLFLSAVAAGSLSTLSSGISALATVTGEDLLKAVFPKIKPNTYAWILKGLTLFFGGVSILFAYLAGWLGQGVFQLSYSVAELPSGSLLGVFLLGIYCHRCNGKGALAGFLSSLLFIGWIKVGSILHPSYRGQNPLSIEDCPSANSSTAAMYSTVETEFTSWPSDYTSEATTSVPEVSGLISVYHISFLYYFPIGLVVTMVVGMAVSALTGFQDPATIDPCLINNMTDALFWYLPESVKYKMRCGKEEIRRDTETPEEEMKEMENGRVNGGFPKNDHDEKTAF